MLLVVRIISLCKGGEILLATNASRELAECPNELRPINNFTISSSSQTSQNSSENQQPNTQK